jgi:putative phosphoribosyl transferase
MLFQDCNSSPTTDRDSAKFADLDDAGRKLAVAVVGHSPKDPLVLAIANGGVPVAITIAEKLHAPLDLILIRRLFVRDDKAFPVCAVNVAGNLVLDSDLETASGIEEQFLREAVANLSNRTSQLRGTTVAQKVASRHVLLIDNGIHTGSTIQIAMRALRRLNPAEITVAVPVADMQIKDTVESVADEVICLEWCDKFGHTGLWYENLNRPNDQEVRDLLKATRNRAG